MSHSDETTALSLTLYRDPCFRKFSRLVRSSSDQPQWLRDNIQLDASGFRDVFAVVATHVQGLAGEKESELSGAVVAIDLLGALGAMCESREPFFAAVSEADQTSAIECLRCLLVGPIPELSRAAARAICRFIRTRTTVVVSILQASGINHQDGETAQSALAGLCIAGPDATAGAIPAVCTVADVHADSDTRQCACRALQDLGETTSPVCQTLTRIAFKDRSQAVRLAAVRALLALFKSEVRVLLLQAKLELSQLLADLAQGGAEFRALRRELAHDVSLPVKRKRSSESDGGKRKLIAALTKHHKYAAGGCLNLEPIGNNELARLARVDKATASAFFKKQFKEHVKYKATCADAARLTAALKLLNGEFAPHLLYGGKPANEDERDEE